MQKAVRVLQSYGFSPKYLQTHKTGCDLLILPTTPDVLALNAFGLTLESLESIEAENYKVLLTIVPPKPSHDGEETRAMLKNRMYLLQIADQPSCRVSESRAGRRNPF